MKRTQHGFYIFCIIVFAGTLFLSSCKTKPPAVISAPAEIVEIVKAEIQIADRFHMSYCDLPCTVYFSDGSEESFTTDVRGKIYIPIKADGITKVSYNFKKYKRKEGRLLAKKDFSNVKLLQIPLNSDIQDIPLDVRADDRCLIILKNRE
ncbi:hypothetical protein [Treponema phagedenis]|uniref:Lipoprotein n=1 Tax=Treponema phagedenis TaxID=162 RepID=A0A0B7GXQ9_TREPH|nr:hypothetical protein [Treponema phagedenis]EFW36715.1 hypothetical protein HMPREF9554_02831 [Treponema phagedenis F0421]NVP24140.1 hypothetical protein [Treponema phagedenis]QEJ96294.1 hypothetical protein FUT79_14525 [Treponema phagedenis]QEJ99298.1 hypothetical protein FUT82_15745 [Treponema phagedenis]QEK00071.1 hypothetical protein FUT84_01995 [Treponema phagedenis]